MLFDIKTEIWETKYRLKNADGAPIDVTESDTVNRVVKAVYANDPSPEHFALANAMMSNKDFVPGGRILAGAGSPYLVTLINCFVNRTLIDSMRGILDGYSDTMLTMQKGGGIGTDFSTLRPAGALVKNLGAISSGPLSFMETWDAGCKTIASAGNRRGAMMATMLCDHPDVIEFITSKRTPGRFTQFNLSVLITDAFMSALAAGEQWDLGFAIPRADNNHIEILERNGAPWYVYNRLPAKALWDMIIRNTYDWAEPGLIFIDRVNQRNNLYYCELIRATNPCGEQPLPPFGDCNLGAVNFANFVLEPFTDNARFDEERFRGVVAESVRFLDNVLDITKYPLPEQEVEAKAKRRVGLGIMGLANMLMMMKVRYGRPSVDLVRKIMDIMADEAYATSALLAAERGSFPAYSADEFLKGYNVQKRSKKVQALIKKHGMRNGVLLTVAPTGTTAIFAGNVSGGLEPVFQMRYTRNVRQPDDTKIGFPVADKGWIDYCLVNGFNPETHPTTDLPDYMVTALNIDVEDHLAIQAACQEFIDASISKTINCPENMDYDDFQEVYMKAWQSGCKGCTTYRPSGVRGAVLEVEGAAKKDDVAKPAKIAKFRRPEVLQGATRKVSWNNGNLYITINNADYTTVDGKSFKWPTEIFVKTNSPADLEMMDALGITITALLRQTATLKQHGVLGDGADMTFLLEHMRTIQSSDQSGFYKQRHVPSRAALIANVLDIHFKEMGEETGAAVEATVSTVELPTDDPVKTVKAGASCSKCGSHLLIRQEGCEKCGDCGHSKCQ